jgi:hypothetical protein
VRRITSPTRPMAWLSLLIMLMAPMSCSTSLGGNGFRTRLRQRPGLGNAGVQVVAHHQHVDMLVEC